MSNKLQNIEILSKFEVFLNSVLLDSSQKENIFRSYSDLKNILSKEPFNKQDVNDFFENYRKKTQNRSSYDLNEIYSKPIQQEEKILTFIMEIQDYFLYNGINLPENMRLSYSFNKIRGFHNKQKNQNFYECLAYSHFENLIKTKNVQKLEYYSKINLSNINMSDYNLLTKIHDLTASLNFNMSKMISLLRENDCSTDFIVSEFIKLLNDSSSLFLQSIVILIKNLIFKLSEDKQTLKLYDREIAELEKEQILLILNSEAEIPFIIKKLVSCALNIKIKILKVDLLNQISNEYIPNINPATDLAHNLEMIYISKTQCYAIGFPRDQPMISSMKTPPHEPQKSTSYQKLYSMPEKNEPLLVRPEFIIQGFELPEHSFSLATTPTLRTPTLRTPTIKKRTDSLDNNAFDLSIPSEKKNIFKVEYEKFDQIDKKNKILHVFFIFSKKYFFKKK